MRASARQGERRKERKTGIQRKHMYDWGDSRQKTCLCVCVFVCASVSVCEAQLKMKERAERQTIVQRKDRGRTLQRHIKFVHVSVNELVV